MARKTVELRREEILDATVQQMQERGLAATRVQDVAQALGVSTGLIFYHFETREQLVADAFVHAAERDLKRLDAVLARRGTIDARLRAVIRLYGPSGDTMGWRLWIDGWSAALHDRGLVEVIRRLDKRWQDAVAMLIAEGVESGDFTCPDPAAAAGRICTFLDGVAVQVVVRTGSLSRAKAGRWIDAFVAGEIGS